MTDDEVIDAYLSHPKTEDTLEDPKFRELSERFHVIARQTFLRAAHRAKVDANWRGLVFEYPKEKVVRSTKT
jgi:hypothetical protein|tara:strand:- start:3197 stop:3412 length:216 start_codon:yes stop_codon:yes gene_type:complete